MGVVYSLREIEAGPVSISATEAKEIKALGERLYDERLKAVLEPDHVGEFLMIEPDSGRYFVNKDAVTAIRDGHAALPDKRFYSMRVGFEAEFAIGTSLKRRK